MISVALWVAPESSFDHEEVEDRNCCPYPVGMAFFLIGCGGEEYTYESDREEMVGPGLISGEKGEITIYKKALKKDEKEVESIKKQ